jgi:hypothetical protein
MPLNVNQNPPPERPLPSLPSYMDSDTDSSTGAAEVRDIPLYRNRGQPSISSSKKKHSLEGSRASPKPEVRTHTLIAQSPKAPLHIPTRVRFVGDMASGDFSLMSFEQ